MKIRKFNEKYELEDSEIEETYELFKSIFGEALDISNEYFEGFYDQFEFNLYKIQKSNYEKFNEFINLVEKVSENWKLEAYDRDRFRFHIEGIDFIKFKEELELISNTQKYNL